MTPEGARGFSITELEGAEVARRLSVVVLPDAPQFEGHFPGRPVLPAVAQLCDLVLPEVARAWPELPALSGCPRLKFSRVVSPGERLTLTLWREAASRVRFELTHEEGTCASGTMTFGQAP